MPTEQNNVVDMDQLERDVRATIKPPPPRDLDQYAPKPKHNPTPLQVIAHAITRLTWTDAEAMGSAIEKAKTDDGTLTAAIQAWAKDWEKMTEAP